MPKVLKFLSHSSIFISICALSLSFYYIANFNLQHNTYKYIVIFCGTLISYISVQLIPINKNNTQTPRSQWIFDNRVALYSILLVSVLSILFCVKYLESFDLLNFAHLFVIILFYEKIFLKDKELRKIPYAKPFIISYVWACIATAPVIILTLNAPNYYIWPECFLFILGLTLPFDIRDIEADKSDGIKTFATKYSITAVKAISILIFFLGLALHYFHIDSSYKSLFITLAIGLTYLFVISKVNQKQKESLFLYGLDGIILLKLLYLI